MSHPLSGTRRATLASLGLLFVACRSRSPESVVRARLRDDFPQMLLARVTSASTVAEHDRPQRTTTVTLSLEVFSLDGWRGISLPARLVYVEEGGARWELLSYGKDWRDGAADFDAYDRARWAESYAAMPEAWASIQEELTTDVRAVSYAARVAEALRLLKHAVDEGVVKTDQVHDAELRDRLALNNLAPVL
jgi:hypothetical protein